MLPSLAAVLKPPMYQTKGPTGNQGPPGQPGDTGEAGPQGLQGLSGLQLQTSSSTQAAFVSVNDPVHDITVLNIQRAGDFDIYGETTRATLEFKKLAGAPIINLEFAQVSGSVNLVLKFSPTRLITGKTLVILCNGSGSYSVSSFYGSSFKPLSSPNTENSLYLTSSVTLCYFDSVWYVMHSFLT